MGENMITKLFYIGIGFGILFLLFKYVFKEPKEKIKKRIFLKVKDWVDTIFVAVVMALLIMHFIIQAFKIPSSSMENTLKVGDHLFVAKIIFGTRIPFIDKVILPIREPKRKEIIVFKFPFDKKKDFVKRCIGLPGDTVEIKNKVVYINGKALYEPYVIFKDHQIYPNEPALPDEYRYRDNWGPEVVPENCYFVLGDNRDASYDSRFWGFLAKRYIVGKPLFIYWPPSRIRIIK